MSKRLLILCVPAQSIFSSRWSESALLSWLNPAYLPEHLQALFLPDVDNCRYRYSKNTLI
jgi:hypothetical protein